VTRDDYFSCVEDAAQTWLTEADAEAWCQENPDEDWEAFSYRDNGEVYDQLMHVIDYSCATDWKEAVSVLNITEQNPDHVDEGLYQGCGWKRILCCIASECYQWDVRDRAEEIYNAKAFEGYLVAIPSNDHQIGHRPNVVRYQIPKERWCVDLRDAIKVFDGQTSPLEFSVIFEGRVEYHRSFWVVYADRVFTSCNSKTPSIDEALERCYNEFMVERLDDDDVIEDDDGDEEDEDNASE